MSLERFLIKDELVIITGGAGLLGRKHAEAIAEIGGIPIVLDIVEQKAADVADGVQHAYQCEGAAYGADVTDENALRQVLLKLQVRFGKAPYGLINNAAIDPKFDHEANKVPKSRLEAFPLAQWDREINVGLTGAFLCAKVFGLEMAKNRKGAIINISSDLGIIAPDQRIYEQEGLEEEMQPVKPVTYSVIKHGLIGLTRYLSTYWRDKGIRVNALCPGGIYTNQSEDFVAKLTSLIPMGRMAEADEYKSTVQFLISDASSYMTGATLVADGGRSAW